MSANPRRSRAETPRQPRPIGVLVRRRWRGVRGLGGDARRQWVRFRGRRSVERPRSWKSWRRHPVRLGILVFFCAVFVAWFVLALVRLSGKQPLPSDWNPDQRCASKGVSCGVVTGAVTPWLTLAVTSVVFLVWRRARVIRPYLKLARTRPQKVVPTAAGDTETVVGRDELCEVTIEDLRSGDLRPRIIVGGIGTGKTAVLQRLAQLLAHRGAVPVAVGLRDAEGRLDFYEMAHKRFVSELAWRAATVAEAERVWHTLSQDGRIVVLADGLEEALADPKAQNERDNEIRRAIDAARERRLRIVVASRPHDPLRGMKANVTALEPLSEEAALEYIGAPRHDEDARRLDWIVETADVASAPLYLEITRALHDENRLQFLSPTELEPGILDSRSADTAALRWRLFETWRDALEKGHLQATVPLDPIERRWTLEHLSALACVGLLQDSLVVKYEDLVTGALRIAQLSTAGATCEPRGHSLFTALESNVKSLAPRWADVRLAATYGAQLGLVELSGESARFRHSLMQAYLGSRYLTHAFSDEGLLPAALEDPGRELLVGLVLRSRCLLEERLQALPYQRAAAVRESVSSSAGPSSGVGSAGEPARPAPTAAADGAASASTQPSVDGWGAGKDAAHEVDQLVALLLDQVRQAARSPKAARGGQATELAKKLDTFAAAFEVDRGSLGRQHADIVEALTQRWDEFDSRDHQVREAKQRLFGVWGEALRGIARDANVAADDLAGQALKATCQEAYLAMFDLAGKEAAYDVRLAIAQTIGRGGTSAYLGMPTRLERLWGRPAMSAEATEETVESVWRARVVAAWITPMLAGTVDDDVRPSACGQLEMAIARVGDHSAHGDSDVLPLSQEIALAQGFKHAANRRLRSPRRRAAVRGALGEQALEMLKQSHYWFTQLTLIQALALWAMPDGDHASSAERQDKANPDALVGRWLDAAGSHHRPRGVAGEHTHPLVNRAAELANLALELRQPERFIWIDESGVVTRVGSQPANRGEHRMHGLWIPPSTGWSSLHPDAQKLAADVLVLQNLADRGADFHQRERYLLRAHQNTLPLCMVHDRTALHVGRSIGAAAAVPGSNCLDGCAFELCPYPAKGTTATVEIPEAFCRAQRARVERRPWRMRRTAPWQALSWSDVRSFWKDMEARARR